MSKKSACGGLFRQKLKKCLRLGAQTPRPPGKAGRYEFTLEGTEGSVSPVARREACARWALGPKAQSDPERGSETMGATVREARMIEQPGHLPPKVAKRPEGVNRNERRARPAAAATIEVAGLRVLQTSPNGLFDSLTARHYAGPLHLPHTCSASRQSTHTPASLSGAKANALPV